MIKKTVLPIIIILFLLTGCSGVKQDSLSTPNSTGVTTQTVVDHSKIRPEIKVILDKLKDSFTNANSRFLGKREIAKFEPKNPMSFWQRSIRSYSKNIHHHHKDLILSYSKKYHKKKLLRNLLNTRPWFFKLRR